jgi:hypothetical protein
VKPGDRIDGAIFSPEERLILCCLRPDAAASANGAADAGARDLASAAGIALDRIDWERVRVLAGSHGVLPLLYRRLKSAEGLAPQAIASIRAQFYGNVLTNLNGARELARIVSLLGAQGIDAIALKGPVLALQGWGDVGMRQFNDLDLLVRPATAARTAEVLIEAGYWPLTFDREHPEVSIGRTCEDEFVRPNSPWAIDLHWELNLDYFAYGPAAADVWERTISITLEGTEMKTLAPDQLVPFLAVHATKHGWITLAWVCDFAAAMRACADSEVPAIAEAARRSGCWRMLLLAMALAAALIDAPIPPLFVDAVRGDAVIASLVAGIERRLFASVGMRARLYSEWAVPLRTIDGGRARVRYVAHRMLTPNTDDFDFVALPPKLYPLYYVTRPLRLAWQQSRRLFVDVPVRPLKRLGAPR